MGFPLAVLEGRRIIKNAFPLAVLLVAATSALAKKIELQVKLLDSIPTTAQYTWWTAAKASSSCEWNGASSGTGSGTGSGTITGNTVDINTETRSQTSSQGSSDCHGTAVPAMTGTSTIGGAEAKLLLPDGRIVIAGCNYKFNWGNWGNNPATKYRSCRTFTPNMYYKAEFSGNNVKIFGRRPSVDGKGKEESETYNDLPPFSSPVISLTKSARVKSLSFWILLPSSAPIRQRRSALFCADGSPSASMISIRVHPTRSTHVSSSFRCCPPNISSVTDDHDVLSELPATRGGG